MKKFMCVAAVMAAFFMPVASYAQCISADTFKEELEKTNLGFVITRLEGSELAKAAAIYNSLPPASENVIRTVFLVARPDGGGLMVVGPAGAVCGVADFDKDKYESLVRFLRGEPA